MTILNLKFRYELSYLPTKRSRIPRFIGKQEVMQLNLSNVNAVAKYDVRELGESYTIYSYKNKLYKPLNLSGSTTATVTISNLQDHNIKTASISRPYDELEDDKKFAFNPAKSITIYGKEQAKVEAKEWAKKHVISVDNKAYIWLKSPAIDADVVTNELSVDRLIIEGGYDDPQIFRLDQLDAFYEYVKHYEDNLTYMLENGPSNRAAAIKYKLEDFKRAIKNNYIKRL